MAYSPFSEQRVLIFAPNAVADSFELVSIGLKCILAWPRDQLSLKLVYQTLLCIMGKAIALAFLYV